MIIRRNEMKLMTKLALALVLVVPISISATDHRTIMAKTGIFTTTALGFYAIYKFKNALVLKKAAERYQHQRRVAIMTPLADHMPRGLPQLIASYDTPTEEMLIADYTAQSELKIKSIKSWHKGARSLILCTGILSTLGSILYATRTH